LEQLKLIFAEKKKIFEIAEKSEMQPESDVDSFEKGLLSLLSNENSHRE